MSTSASESPVTANPPTEPAAALPAGTLVAERYRIESLLGEGGMGSVYLAEHVHMRKQFALKVLHPAMSSLPEIATRFEREAIAAGRIDHPNVAAASDFGKLPDGSFFLVLEYIKGRTLRDLVSDGPLEPRRALRIAQGIAAALGAAHAKGVVHRDLKPENVMLVTRGADADFVKVLDFGIAKVELAGAAPGTQPLTQLGAIMGTPDYMSPEQAVGQPVDFRTDLYSLGVILYELLAGERPFSGGAVTVLRQHVLEEPPPLPAETLAKLDPRAASLLARLLAKVPEARGPGAHELSLEIAETLGSPTPRAPTVRDAALGVMPTMIAGASPTPPPTAFAATRPKKSAVLGVMIGASLLVLLTLVFVVRAIWPSSAEKGSGAGPGEASATAVVLPPPPSPPTSSPSARPAATEPATSDAKGGKGPSTSPTNPATKGGKKETRKTGPGGIYIPPPSQWFN